MSDKMTGDFLPTFKAVPDKRVPEGQCLVYLNSQVVYAGPIRRCPAPVSDSVMYLHPTDFKDIDNRMKKLKH